MDSLKPLLQRGRPDVGGRGRTDARSGHLSASRRAHAPLVPRQRTRHQLADTLSPVSTLFPKLANMRVASLALLVLAACAASLNYASADITGGVKQLQIGVKVSCTLQALITSRAGGQRLLFQPAWACSDMPMPDLHRAAPPREVRAEVQAW